MIAELIGIAYYDLRVEALQNALAHKRITRQQYTHLFKNLETLVTLHKNEIRKGKLSRMVVQHQRPHHLRLLKLEPHFYQQHHISLCYEGNSEAGRCSIYKKEVSASSLQAYYSRFQSISFRVTGVKMLGQYIALTLASPIAFKHSPLLHVSIIQASFASDLNEQIIAKLQQKLEGLPFTVELSNISCRKKDML